MAGKEFLQPDWGNPDGYWEDREFLELNKRLLKWAGGEWQSPSGRKDLLMLRKKSYPRIIKLIEARMLQNPDHLWGWKDPRNSLVAHLYHELYPKSKFIIMRRNRPAVIRSLERLRGKGRWSQLCKNYNDHISAFLATELPKFINVQYELLTLNPSSARAELVKVCRFIGADINRIDRALEIIHFVAEEE